MEIKKKEAFQKQIALYLTNSKNTEALELTEAFIQKFPKDVTAYFLCAKAAFALGDYTKSTEMARSAFNLSSKKDLPVAAVLLACNYYQLGEYQKGYAFLAKIPESNADLEELRLLYAVALGDAAQLKTHGSNLVALDPKRMEHLLVRLVESLLS